MACADLLVVHVQFYGLTGPRVEASCRHGVNAYDIVKIAVMYQRNPCIEEDSGGSQA